MSEQTDTIQDNLTQKIEAYKLRERVTFDDSALEELRRISDGEWNIAEQYAASAILDALQNQRDSITADNIKVVDIAEIANLILGGKDIWDQVRYIGTQVPDMFPEGVQLRRALSLWDANRSENAHDSVREGRLPQYALTDRIEYSAKGTIGPEVKVPFKYDTSAEEIEAVASNLAKFVSSHEGKPHDVKSISRGGMGLFGAEYFVRQRADEGQDPHLLDPSYRVSKSFAFGISDAQGVVLISSVRIGKRDGDPTLEAYVQSVKLPTK